MLENYRKVDVKKPTGATPHGHAALVRFGAESCARRARKKNRFWVVNEGKHLFQREMKMASKS